LVTQGATEVGRPATPITAFALAAVEERTAAARDAVREAVGFFLQAEADSALVGRSPCANEIREQIAAGGSFAARDAWVDEFAVAGTPDEAAARLRRLYDAGADSVGLWLFPAERLAATLRTLAASSRATQVERTAVRA
jgi:alkanesulfonate monooxygenase SsuD/methylene tetrahydromethanopterin reductase-like flavin-dependent oxidoreductase (luciferase family)